MSMNPNPTHVTGSEYIPQKILSYLFLPIFPLKRRRFNHFSPSFKHCHTHTHRARAVAKRKSNVHVDAPAMPLRVNAFIPLQTHRFGVLRSVAAVPRGAGERTGARRSDPPANRDPIRFT